MKMNCDRKSHPKLVNTSPQPGQKCSSLIVFSQRISSYPLLSKKAAETALSTERNPIARYIAERHAPAHESLALGKKNAEVGAELWITENSVKQALKKIFRKLEVSSCTEIAVQLSAEKQPQ